MENVILDAENLPGKKLYEADRSMRFLNFIIDYVMYLVSVFAVLFIIGFIFGINNVFFDENAEVISNFIFIGWYFLFYFLQENYFNGRTVGKYFTKTRAVSVDNLPLNSRDAAIRSICRIIPFDMLSFLFSDSGWHDKIAKTKVVDWPKNH